MKFLQAVKEYKTRHSKTNTVPTTDMISEPINLSHESYDGSRASSSASMHSNNSKKLAWLLGPDAIDVSPERSMYSRTSSPLQSKDDQDDNWPLTSGSEGTASDDEEEIESTQINLLPFATKGMPKASTSVGQIEPAKEQLAKPLQKVEPTPVVAPSSPDVDALSVSTFAPFPPKTSVQSSTPRSYGNLEPTRATSPEEPVDFNEVCERLLDTLSSSLTRPSLDQYQSGSSLSSSKSSTMLYTEPASPQSFSSASSLDSFEKEEKMQKAKNALVADQAAIEAKLKLAAARDALKRVRSNIVTPKADINPALDIHRPAPARAYTTQIRPSSHTRAMSDHYSVSQAPASMRHSRSSSSLLTEHSSKESLPSRSSRSSRVVRNHDLPLFPQKSDVRIGLAAPKDLSVLKKNGGEQRASHGKRPTSQLKAKSKSALYIPQNHITSINEVLA